MQTINKLDLGNAANAPDNTVTIERIGANNMRFTSPAAGSIDLEDFVLPGGVHALEDHTDVTVTAAATGEILRYDGADWVDSALAALDSSDSSVLGVLRAIDAAGNVVFNEEGLDIDYRMESTGQVNMFVMDAGTDSVNIKGATPTAGSPLRIAGKTESTSFLSILYSSDANLAVRTGTAGDLQLDAGGSLIVRDRDSAFATVFTLDSATGDIHCFGDMQTDGEINGDLVAYIFTRATVPTLNNTTAALELQGILCTASKGLHIGGPGSIVEMGINYNVDAKVAGGGLNLGVAIDGGAVFLTGLDPEVADDKVDEASQPRNTDQVVLNESLAMFIVETGSQNVDTSDIIAWVVMVMD